MPNEKHWTDGLSARVANVIRSARFTSKEGVREAISSGRIKVRSIPNLGKKGVDELYSWIGVERQNKKSNVASTGNRWQSIETAPKDGTHVLLYQNGAEESVSEGWWSRRVTNGLYCWGGHGWWFPSEAQPTHWMPIPAPPVTKEP